MNVNEVGSYLTDLNLGDISDVSVINKGVNSRILHIKFLSGDDLCLKFYRNGEEGERGIKAEIPVLQKLEESGFDNVPRVISSDTRRKVAVFNWIKAPEITLQSVTPDLIDACINFYVRIQSVQWASDFGSAKESFKEPAGHLENIAKRIIYFSSGPSKELKSWIQSEFLPVFNRLRLNTEPQSKVERLIFSPSDVGFHNTLGDTKRLYFFDFEYAGWDDPAKLICDFVLRPGNISAKDKAYAYSRLCEAFSMREDEERRTRLLYPILGLKWCLIMLNRIKETSEPECIERCDGYLKNLLKENDSLPEVLCR